MKTRFLILLVLGVFICGSCNSKPAVSIDETPVTATASPRVAATTSGALPTPTPTPLVPPVTPTSVPSLVFDLSEYTDVTTWEVYPLPHTSGALLAPPGWVVTEGSEMGERLYSLAFQPPVWDSPEACGYQCPVISVAVYRLAASSAPPDAVLPTWLAQRATAEPFGADVAEDVMYFDVGTPIETMLGALPALGFSHEAMGIQLYTTLAVVEDVVIAFTKTHVQQFDFEPIYDLMRAQARF